MRGEGRGGSNLGGSAGEGKGGIKFVKCSRPVPLFSCSCPAPALPSPHTPLVLASTSPLSPCRNGQRLELMYVHSSHPLAPTIYELEAK